jgi:hypothetical protein
MGRYESSYFLVGCLGGSCDVFYGVKGEMPVAAAISTKCCTWTQDTLLHKYICKQPFDFARRMTNTFLYSLLLHRNYQESLY